MARVNLVGHYGAVIIEIDDDAVNAEIAANYANFGLEYDGTILLQGDDAQGVDMDIDEWDSWDLVVIAGYSSR